MDFTVGLVFAVVFLVTFFFFTKPKNLPPGPIGLPVVGSAFMLNQFRHQRPHKVLFEAAKKYGNVLGFYLGKRYFVVLSGYDAVHEALVKHADVFSDRPVNSFNNDSSKQSIRLLSGKGILFHGYGDSWRALRRFTLQSLRDFGVGKTSIEEKIFVELDYVTKAFVESEARPIDTSDFMQKLVGNVLFGIVFGKRFDYNDPEFNKIRRMLTTVISGTGILSGANFLPKFLAKLVNTQDANQNKRRNVALQEVFEYTQKQIDEHEATFDKDNIRDFVDVYLQTKVEGHENAFVDLPNMFRVILDLFLAGSETTYTTLDWALLYMSELQDIQARCQREITEVFGDKPVLYTDRGKMPYLEATLMEIQRISTIVPLSVAHRTMKDVTFRGYTIPANTIVIPNLYSVSNDTSHWDRPEEFRPERFLTDNGKPRKPEAFIPFSTGPRICLGEPLAKMELFLVFTNLLQRFTFKREIEAVKNPMEPKQYQITNAPMPYKLRLFKRT